MSGAGKSWNREIDEIRETVIACSDPDQHGCSVVNIGHHNRLGDRIVSVLLVFISGSRLSLDRGEPLIDAY